MSTLFLFNCGLEQELESGNPWRLLDSMTANAFCRRLQYLPLLLLQAGEEAVVTAPPAEGEGWRLLDDPRSIVQTELLPWALTPAVAEWAAKRGKEVAVPSWEALCEVNSKAYSFTLASPLPGASLLYTPEELERWLALTPLPAVLKQSFGLAGRGKLLLPAKESPLTFCQREWARGGPIIAEPWVDRLLDFSSQWDIDRCSGAPRLKGVTLILNSPHGAYRGNQALIEKHYPPLLRRHLAAHLEAARHALGDMAKRGYFGPAGLDAMIYLWQGEERLHPIVEINARLTMGAFALLYGERRYPGQSVEMTLGKEGCALYPIHPSTI